MVDFICMGLLDLWWAQTGNQKMKNSCPQLESNLGPSANEPKLLRVALFDEISIKHLNVDRLLPKCAIYINLKHVVDVANLFVVYFCHIIFVASCCLINKTFADCKGLIKYDKRQNIFLHLPRGTCYRYILKARPDKTRWKF